MKPEKKAWFGVDFGGTAVKTALVDRNGKIIRESNFPTTLASTPDAWIKKVSKMVNALSKTGFKIQTAGIGVPGFVDYDRGLIHNLTNVPGWDSVPLADLLSARLRLPVVVDNDANAMALGEFVFGAGKNYRHAVFVTLGTGVGGGLLIDGKIYRGAYSMGGEIGHIPISMKGRKTREGTGGLETYTGNREITKRAKTAIRRGRKSMISDMINGRLDLITPKMIAQAAHAGDELSIEIFDFVADCLATAFAGITYVLQPEIFIVGGGVANSGKILFDPLRRHLVNRLSPHFAEHIKVIRAEIGERAGVTGAAALGMTKNEG